MLYSCQKTSKRVLIFLGHACLTVHFTSGSDASFWLSLLSGVSPLDSVSLLLSPDTPQVLSICSKVWEEKSAGRAHPTCPSELGLGPTGWSGGGSRDCSERRRGEGPMALPSRTLLSNPNPGCILDACLNFNVF